MKTACTILISAILIASPSVGFSQGYIIPNGVTYAGYTSIFGGYEIDVIQNPTNSDYTGFALEPKGKTPPTTFYTNTFHFDLYLDEGVRVFLVNSNQPISLQPILSQSYLELAYQTNSVFTNGRPFYLGLYTGFNPYIVTNGTSVYTGIYERPVFGWGRFVNNQGAIQMLDSALEIEGGGIYAGTQTIIATPEPSAWALSALGGLFFACHQWRRVRMNLLSDPPRRL